MEEIEEDNNTNENEENSQENLENVINIIRPVILLEYCCGIFRFSVDNETLMPPKIKMKVYSVAISCTIIISTILFMPAINFTNDVNIFDILNSIGCLVIVAQYVIYALITSFLHNKTNICIISMFAELDKMLNIDSIKTIYISSRKRTVAYLIIIALTHLGHTLYYCLLTDNISGIIVIAGQLNFIQKLEILMFYKIIGMLEQRLHILNEYLMKFIEETDNDRNSIFTVAQSENTPTVIRNWVGRPSDENVKIHDLALAYDHIETICGLINHAFNFHIFMTFLTTFECIIVTIWALLYVYLSTQTHIGISVHIAIWLSTAILNIVVMTFACEKLLNIREETKILVNRIIMSYDLPKIMRNQAKAFMELKEAWPLSISIYDMFAVDITLILKFISVATTYLIVIIQISRILYK